MCLIALFLALISCHTAHAASADASYELLIDQMRVLSCHADLDVRFA